MDRTQAGRPRAPSRLGKKRKTLTTSPPDAADVLETMENRAEFLLAERNKLVEEALTRGRGLVANLVDQIKDDNQDDPDPRYFRAPIDLFDFVLDLEPENLEAKEEIDKLSDILLDEEAPEPPPSNHDNPFDVIIVGAGASGVGMGFMLTRIFNLDPHRVLLLERGEKVGDTFLRWPKEMRFISPSFNSQGWTGSFDLNSVAYGSSPAYSLHGEHPSGEDYAHYLHDVVETVKLNVQTNTEVIGLRPRRRGGFAVDVVRTGMDQADAEARPVVTTLRSQYIIWAAGEYQYPQPSAPTFLGSELCRHNSTVQSWKTVSGNDFIVIGGYESGMDAAFNLASCKKHCTVLSSKAFWQETTDDPSTELSPYTAERMREALASSAPPRLRAPLRVFKVERHRDGGYVTHARWMAPEKLSVHQHAYRELPVDNDRVNNDEIGKEGTEIKFRSPQPPFLCTGFGGSAAMGAAKDLFEWGKDGDRGCAAGSPLLNECDESTMTPGLFLVGPAVSHENLVFCFIYKFRQRFGIVADAIARGLGHETAQTIDECRKMDMFLDDFSCCKGACGDVC